MEILVLNCGSSSVKYHLFDIETEQDEAGGMVERIGQADALATHRWAGGSAREERPVADHHAALLCIRAALRVLEEFARLVKPSASRSFGSLRFKVYSLEQTFHSRSTALRHR